MSSGSFDQPDFSNFVVFTLADVYVMAGITLDLSAAANGYLSALAIPKMKFHSM
jgi:hypothetical protein